MRTQVSRRTILFSVLAASSGLVAACSGGLVASVSENSSKKKVIRIAIGTQDQVINTATGGPVIREEKLLEKYLPKTGKYENVEYKIEWSSYTSGPPITNKMLANQIDIGMMGDFPATINMTTFQKKGGGVKTLYVATLGYGATGAGNAVLVPKDSSIKTLADLRGKQVSVPFGSAAHGMLLKALQDSGLDSEKDLKLISQAPEVGGTSLRTNQIDAHANFVPFGELFPFRGFARKIFDGAQTGVPTFHGVLVRSDFAQQYPEIVVAYLKALLEANKMLREQPEAIATKVEEWSGVEREVVYMFLGPGGLQRLNPTIRPVNFDALKNSVITLKQLKRLEEDVNPNDISQWADDSFLKQAIQEMNLKYDDLATGDEFPIEGLDAVTQEPIKDTKLAAQIWVKGEEKVMNFASIKTMMGMLQKLKADGKKATGAIFVHDFNQGWKLFAENSFFVRKGDEIVAFLSEKAAQNHASKIGAQVASFKALQDLSAREISRPAGAYS
ncbi:ABC transporter substrate-binding protein [Leptolyngbya sp. 'hensonii']|uniref:ABC transporter substrate-binding protein n=1 Tax=Leptolyngbya sp. 'hensonii' TaxID=1922337 RepID=UPI00095B22C0|nr:ABC transporter substrate-binding protein [Leptolyngbya sp. 'hensonii']OLP17230.1 ABC transporter substrate-binding protein [Leptolyngbya sp. 'hensonii']